MFTKMITAISRINKDSQEKAKVPKNMKSRRAQKNHTPKNRAKKMLCRKRSSKRSSKRKRQRRRKKPNDVYEDQLKIISLNLYNLKT